MKSLKKDAKSGDERPKTFFNELERAHEKIPKSRSSGAYKSTKKEEQISKINILRDQPHKKQSMEIIKLPTPKEKSKSKKRE
jgi:hypothetical protein